MKILVTGGPVPAKLDAVKIVTNRFKGGLMAELVDALATRGAQVTYLCSRDSKRPGSAGCTVLEHDGFHDYRAKVLERAAGFDAVVLGAAVANLLPVRWQTDPGGELKPVDPSAKFPSHHFAPGDVFSMEWQIAPRVISETKKHLKAGAHLFGFKLLSGVPRDELVSAAYEIVLGAGATAVFANDAQDLLTVHAVTKERGVHSLGRDALAGFILEACADAYYRTEVQGRWPDGAFEAARRTLLAAMDPARMVSVPEGLVFGTAAVRAPTGGFFTTERGKRELDGAVQILEVDHERRVVRAMGGKATLNAPLLDRVFRALPKAVRIAHYHQQEAGLPTLAWAPPGTARDSDRGFSGSFNIAGHGCVLAFDAEGTTAMNPEPLPEAYPDRETYQTLYRRYVGERSRPAARLLELGGDLAGKHVLDLCGGAGALSLEARARGASSVTMVDLALQMADLEALAAAGVRLESAEVVGWLSRAQPRSFDAAFCRQAVNYWLTREAAGLLALALRPGGTFVFNTFCRKPPPSPADGLKSYGIDGKGFVELSWLCADGTVHHVQCREGLAPHATRFRWISEEDYRAMLEARFSLEIRTEGGTAIYLCRRLA